MELLRVHQIDWFNWLLFESKQIQLNINSQNLHRSRIKIDSADPNRHFSVPLLPIIFFLYYLYSTNRYFVLHKIKVSNWLEKRGRSIDPCDKDMREKKPTIAARNIFFSFIFTLLIRSSQITDLSNDREERQKLFYISHNWPTAIHHAIGCPMRFCYAECSRLPTPNHHYIHHFIRLRRCVPHSRPFLM